MEQIQGKSILVQVSYRESNAWNKQYLNVTLVKIYFKGWKGLLKGLTKGFVCLICLLIFLLKPLSIHVPPFFTLSSNLFQIFRWTYLVECSPHLIVLKHRIVRSTFLFASVIYFAYPLAMRLFLIMWQYCKENLCTGHHFCGTRVNLSLLSRL